MKIANILSILLLSCIFVALTAEPAQAAFDDYQRFRKGTYDFEVETQYFKTDANYAGSGNAYQKLILGQSFEIYNVFLKTRYDMSKRSSWYANLDIANSTSNGLDASRNNSSLAGALFGYAYRPYDESFDVITDFNVLVPFSSIDVNTDSSLNSEGVIEATGLLRVQKEFSSLLGFGYIGGTFRQSRSALLPWGAGMELSYPSWSLGGKVFGAQSISDDPDTGNTLQRTIVTNRVNASSLKFYSVNPSIIDSEVYVKFKFKNAWTLAVGGGTTITGSNAAAGFHAGASMKFSWETEPSYYLKPPGSRVQDDGLSSEKKVPKFKEEIDDGVNQELFKKKTPPGRPRPGSGDLMAPATDAVTMKKIENKATPATSQEAQEGGEVQIKLKKVKKKKRS